MNRYRHMEIFVSIIETGQFTKAAAALGVSKSTVSHAMNELEKYLGLQLINRTSRSLQMTEAGQRYYQESVRIMSDLAELEHRVRDSDQVISGRIRLSAPAAYLSMNLSSIIADFMDIHPALKVEFILTEKILDLIDEGLDFAIRIGDLKDSRMIVRKISEISHIACAAPAYIKTHGPIIDHAALESVNCMKYTGTPTWHLSKGGTEYRVQPKGNVVSNNGEVLREMAIAGQGVAFLPIFLAEPAVSMGRLVRVLSDYESRRLNVSIVRPPSQRLPARVRSLIDFITERYAEIGI